MAPRPLEARLLADKREGERIQMRVFPASAAVDVGDGRLAVPLSELEPILVNPQTPGYEHEAWPLAGIELVSAPKEAVIPTSWIEKRLAESQERARHGLAPLISLEGERMVHRPGGPRDLPFRVTHSFRQVDAIVIHAASGDVRYRVIQNPDKWPNEKIEDDAYPDGLGFGGEVRWVYIARRED